MDLTDQGQSGLEVSRRATRGQPIRTCHPMGTGAGPQAEEPSDWATARGQSWTQVTVGWRSFSRANSQRGKFLLDELKTFKVGQILKPEKVKQKRRHDVDWHVFVL